MTRERDAAAFARTALATYGTNLAVAVLSLANVLVVARALGPAGRGDVAFLITVAMLASNLAAFGVQEANANIGGSRPLLRRALAGNSLLFAASFGALAAAAVVLLVTVFPAAGGEVDRALLWVALVAIPPLLLKTYLSFLAQSDYRFAVTNAAWLVGPLTSFVANTVLAFAGALTVTTAIVAWVAGQLLGMAILVVHVARNTGFGRPDESVARESLGFGAKTHLGRFLQVGNYRLDQWLIGAIVGSRELGLYSVAVAWAEVLFYIPGVLVMVQRPHLVRAERGAAGVFAARVFRVALLIAVGCAVVLVALAPVLCTFVFGAAFAGSVDDLRVLALAAFGICAIELLGSALNAQRRPMLTTSAVATAFVATVVLDLLLIPPLGGLGAAIATATAWSLGGVVIALLFGRTLGISPRALVPRPGEVPALVQRIRTTEAA